MSTAGSAAAIEGSVTDLSGRLASHLRAAGLLPEGTSVTVALSGGLDSVVLLDVLMSLRDSWGWSLSAAHFDHRMRPESASEAEWVRSLCERRDVPCVSERAHEKPGNEAQARDLRYEFLDRARRQLGAEWLATAHQADDQAETVLFRLLRGSGLAGLSGIPARRQPNLVRPLLPFWRREIERYADAKGLDRLTDPSNLDVSYARNRLRLEVIPRIEAGDIPDLRVQLCRLARLAGRATRAVEELCELAVSDLVLEASETRTVVARKGLLAYDKNVRAHLLRVLVRGLGVPLSRSGTHAAVEFISHCPSGRGIDLAGGIIVRREFERLILERRSNLIEAPDENVAVGQGGEGEAVVRIAGVRWRVRWASGALEGTGKSEEALTSFDSSELVPPLSVRSWRPGDRIRLAGGTRKLKKLFVDRKVGRWQRGSYPVLIDSNGVLWIVGLARSVRARSRVEGDGLTFGFRREG